MKDKNSLIIGAAGTGKTTLAKRFSKETGYHLIGIRTLKGELTP